MTQTTNANANPTRAELTQQLEALERRASHLAEYLPYAEGQAYRDEQRTLSDLRQKIATLKKQLAEPQE